MMWWWTGGSLGQPRIKFYFFIGNNRLVAKEERQEIRRMNKAISDYAAKCYMLSK